MATNEAAWILEEGSKIVVQSSVLPTPGEGEIVVKVSSKILYCAESREQNESVALNPIDPKIQAHSMLPMTYPTILGGSIAGEVYAVGSSVTRFKVGDRVTSSTPYYALDDSKYGAFQKYTLTLASSTIRVCQNFA
jgi:threonine dehydrogenase-like Zn-dependent dehydrogenase